MKFRFLKKAAAFVMAATMAMGCLAVLPEELFSQISVKADAASVSPWNGRISMGGAHSACITANGDLYTWGHNYYGQLGDGTTTARYTPEKIVSNVSQVSIGNCISAYITENDDLYTWGCNEYGKLGDGTTTDRYTPTKIMSNVVQVSLGHSHSACITENGDLYTWGRNNYGQLGDGTTTDRYTPVKIMSDVSQVSLGFYHSACITKNGDLYTWGANFYGQLGDGTTTDRYTPVKIMSNVDQISLGGYYSACITENGDLYTWGYNNRGQLGNGTRTHSSNPQKIMSNVSQVSLGGYHSACITENGNLYMWGSNSSGKLGDGTTTNRYTPVKIMSDVSQVNLGYYYSACITTSGDLYTWGWNEHGELGDGTRTDSSTPKKIYNLAALSCKFSALLDGKDLVTTYHKYYLSNNSFANDQTFSIVCNWEDLNTLPQKYQLYKGTTLISESYDGKIIVSEKSLLTTTGNVYEKGKLIEGDVFVNVIYNDGTNTKIKLKLDIAQSDGVEDVNEVTFFGDDGLNIKISDNIPIIGGSDISLSGSSFPVYISAKSDGTVRVGVNIIDKDLLDDDSSWNNFKNCYEENKKQYDYNLNRYKNAVLGKKNLADLKKYLKTTKNKNFKLFDPKNEVNLTVAGYGEGKITESGVTSVEVSITVGIEYEGSISWQTFVAVVPVVIEGSFKAGANGEGNFKWEYDKDKDSWKYTGEVLLNIEVEIEVFAGVGVKKVLSVGVTGGGKLDMAATVYSSKKKSGVDTVDATLSAGIKAKFLIVEYKKNYIEKTYNIYARDPSTALKDPNDELLIDIYNQDNYVIDREIINETVDRSASGDIESTTVISGIQCSASPEIISVNNGVLMTYLSSDQDRGASNASVLKYMFYNNATKTWTAAEQADTDSTADWYSKLYSFGGKTYLIYSQADKTFGDDVSIEELLASMKITVAEYDTENNKFVNFTDISIADGRYNSMPQFAVNNDALAAVWINSSSEDMFLQSSDNAVQISTLTDGVWSSPFTVKNNINTITDVACGELENTPYIAVCSNNSNDLSVTDNSCITVFDLEGNVISSFEGNADNLEYVKLPGVSQNAFAWYKNGNIEYTTNASQLCTLFAVDEENGMNVSSNYVVGEDKIFYTYTNNEGQSAIYQILWDNGEWSAPINSVSAEGYISALTENDGVLVYSDTIVSANDEDVNETTSIDFCRYKNYYDIEASGLDFDYTQIAPGQTMNVELLISNNSNTVLNNVTVAFSKGSNEVISEETVECSIKPGDYAEVSIPFTVPSEVDDTVFTAVITGDKTDTSPENNSIDFDFGKTELVLSASEKLLDGKCYYVAEISNNSYISTSGTLELSDASGNVVYTTKIDSIPANKITYHSIDISEFGVGEDSEIFTCKITADKDEYFSNNNIVSEYVSLMNDELPYVIVVFMDGDGKELSRNVYNKGDSITAPSIPSGFDRWVVLGDESFTPVTNFDNITEDTVFVPGNEPLPKAEVTDPVSTPIALGQTLKDAVLTEGWKWVDDSIKPEAVGEYSFEAYMDVLDDDKYDYSDIDGYNQETHKITRKVSVTVINEVIAKVEITNTNVIVSYCNADVPDSVSRTVTLGFDDVSEEIVEYMSSDIELVIAFVNAFTSAEKVDSQVLTSAQLKAIEIVLEHDYGEE